MEFKGTKGEWMLQSEEPIEGAYAAQELLIDYNEYHQNCVSVYCGKDDVEEQIANAKLIAAAPELLEALQDLVRYCDENETGAELELSRSAIKKALK